MRDFDPWPERRLKACAPNAKDFMEALSDDHQLQRISAATEPLGLSCHESWGLGERERRREPK